MDDSEVLQSGRQGRRQVWLLTANGVVAGLITVVVMGVAQRHMAKERASHDRILTTLGETVGSLEKFRVVGRDHLQFLLSGRPMVQKPQHAQKDAILRESALRLVGNQSSLLHHRDQDLAEALRQAEAAVSAIQESTQDAMHWQLERERAWTELIESRSVTRDLLTKLRNDCGRLEGRLRLTIARQLRTHTKGEASVEEGSAQNTIDAFRLQSSYLAWRGELADLAVRVEQLIASDHQDGLANLRDNEIKPTLERLRETVANGALAGALQRVSESIFGAGFVIDKAHQTIVNGQGGLFAATRRHLVLQQQRQQISDAADRNFAMLRDAVQLLDNQTTVTAHQLADRLRTVLHTTWLIVLAVGLCGVTVFIVLARRIAATIAQQIDTIARKTKELSLAQKLESIGALAAGIAHEINTPMQFVSDNIDFLDESFRRISLAFDELAVEETGGPNAVWTPHVERCTSSGHAGLGQLRLQIHQAIDETRDGVTRVIRIVRAMKEFTHPGGEAKVGVDLNQAIQSAATITRNQWKYTAQLELDLEPSLPEVFCIPGEINQVFLNLIVNSADALAENAEQRGGELGVIRVSTFVEGESVVVKVSDTGCGIPENIRHRICEPFFTTKDIGKGTGQGLTICYNIVVQKLGGTIDFESIVGQGTTFRITIPIQSQIVDAAGTTQEESQSCSDKEPYETSIPVFAD